MKLNWPTHTDSSAYDQDGHFEFVGTNHALGHSRSSIHMLPSEFPHLVHGAKPLDKLVVTLLADAIALIRIV
jgi:hypothetical protein